MMNTNKKVKPKLPRLTSIVVCCLTTVGCTYLMVREDTYLGQVLSQMLRWVLSVSYSLFGFINIFSNQSSIHFI